MAPATANVAPPGHYLLFIVNGNGVPSVGNVVRLTAAVPAATLTSLSPISAAAGGGAFTLTVNGTGFVNGATVQWNGQARTTTFAGSSQLTAAIAGSDIGAAGTSQVTVVNPGAGASNALTFTITPPPASSFTLNVSKSGPGTVTSSPAGINCGADCSESYAAGSVVTLTATPNKNARFQGWGGAGSGTGARTVTMNAAQSVTATFRNR